MHDFVAMEPGFRVRDFYARPDLMVPASLEVQSRYGLDVANLIYDMYNVEVEGLGQRVSYPAVGMPDVDRREPLVREVTDLAQIRSPTSGLQAVSQWSSRCWSIPKTDRNRSGDPVLRTFFAGRQRARHRAISDRHLHPTRIRTSAS